MRADEREFVIAVGGALLNSLIGNRKRLDRRMRKILKRKASVHRLRSSGRLDWHGAEPNHESIRGARER